ncbi:conserved phage C-terminal domain-containing protein [Vagococcus xieshaowenii]|uniref:conserved phage C-terminal domain-containing protein n=1 Tax=Vagococcus xieshaowenii TaxID=2562451 RepID=UPI0014324C74|nr:conserved phage C-terminal domain-containing protein [Vagococcus xieshaowenii]
MTKYKNDPKKKRYYWLQLKEDFFNQKEIKLLRKIAGGDTFTIIYLKMLLLSLKDEGKLYFEAIGDDFIEEVALAIDESMEDVSVTISFLQKKKLIEIVEEDEYFLNRVPDMVGSEAYSTERSRRHRAKKRIENNAEVLQSNGEALQCNSNETDRNEEKRRDREREEIDIEIDIDIEREVEQEERKQATSSPSSPHQSTINQVIDYLNEKTNGVYKASDDNVKLITSQIENGYTFDDFKQVIMIKTTEWLYDDKMNKYLRPSTLFGNKMGDYLSEAYRSKNSTSIYKPPKVTVPDEWRYPDDGDNTGVHF